MYKAIRQHLEMDGFFTGFSLRDMTIPAVPAAGKHPARIMFIGAVSETHKNTQDQGRPFEGEASQLLDKIIKACHLEQKDIYLINILKCMSSDSKCTGYLQTKIEHVSPEIIVALGKYAACALLKCNVSIDELRAKFYLYPLSSPAKPIKIMPTYDPDYLLKNYTTENRTRVWQDMQKVIAELGMTI